MERITLKNFRCFREEQTAQLAPLTLLVGENSTGKTSFLSLIRTLKNVACYHSEPDFKEEPYDLGTYDEIAHHRGGRGSRAETFEAGFHFTPQNGDSVANSPYRFEVTFGRKDAAPIVIHKRISGKEVQIEYRLEGDGALQFFFNTPERSWQRTVSAATNSRIYGFPLFIAVKIVRNETETIPTNLSELRDPDRPTNEDWELIDQVTDSLSRYTGPAYASAPVRSKPRRTYEPARTTRDPEGDYAPMYLASRYFQKGREWKQLRAALERFGKASGLFDEIVIKPLAKGNSGPFQLQIRKFGGHLKGPARNLIDVGCGVSQALPIITELLRPDAPSLFLLQQPEVHLHPSAQASLGSLLCDVATTGRQLVVETHSDHLLDRVRMDVRDSETVLKPENVSILFFERRGLDVHIHSLGIDEEGNIIGAPDGYRSFFMNETRRSLGL